MFSTAVNYYARAVAAVAAAFVFCAAAAESKNGFDLSGALINPADVLYGGPPKDGIPAINAPRFVPAAEADYLRDSDIVIGVVFANGQARAYPHRILVWHEVVNDELDGERVAVTYCPLCGTGMVFAAEAGGAPRTFGVSGLLYRSDVLLYDRESESLWSQLKMQAVSGKMKGAALSWLPSAHQTWAAWKSENPNGEVLSDKTGYNRDYNGAAYADYFASPQTMFPVPRKRRELPNKEWVAGVIINGEAKAYPLAALPDNKTFQDKVGGKIIKINYNAEQRHPQITDEAGALLPSVVAFWFAWQAFYPDTALWSAAE